MENKMPANGSADHNGRRDPISLTGTFVAEVLARPAAGVRNKKNIMDKKRPNLFWRLFSILHMSYFNFREILKPAN